MTETMETSEVSRALPDLVKRIARQETRVVVEEDGKPVAALISPSDLERLNLFDARRAEAWRVFDEIHANNLDKDPDEVERDVAEALTDVRAQQRALNEHPQDR